MVEIKHKEREIRAKIVYYGPAAGGKTTNLLELSRRANPDRRGQMLSVNTTQERTLLLDLVGVRTPAFRNFDIRFQVIAVPGQKMYAASRRFLLNGADSVVFVANSAADRWGETLESMKEMNEYLAAQGMDPKGIPVVFQYNKQDLPEVTPKEAMERTLNARKSDSFAAVAFRGEGVLETFRAALRRTLKHIMEDRRLGEQLQEGPSVEDWVEKTMEVVFGSGSVEDETGEAAASDPRPGVSSAAVLDASPDDLWRTSVRVKSSGKLPATAPALNDKAADSSETAEHLVENYVEAAARLSEDVDVLRDQHEATEQRLEELSASIDAAQALLSERSAADVLEDFVERIGKGLGSDVGSLSLIRPDGGLSPVVRRNLDAEPVHELRDGEGRPLAASLMEQDAPVVFKRGDTGPLQAALDKLNGKYTALVAIPVKTPVRSLGLACYYLPPESAAPSEGTALHLTRLGRGLALALEVASLDVASQRLQTMERAALVGHLTEEAITEIGLPIDRLLTSVGNAIAQIPHGSATPPKLLGELLNVSKDLVQAQEMRQGVRGFLSGILTEKGVARMEEVLERIRTEYAEPLRRTGIELKVEASAEVESVAADGFLLRCALLSLVEHFRNYLAGCKGGEIRIAAEQLDGDRVRIAVSDNTGAGAASAGRAAIPDYLSWSLDRRVQGFGLSLAQRVVEHYKGEWQMSASDEGNAISLVFPAHLEQEPPQGGE